MVADSFWNGFLVATAVYLIVFFGYVTVEYNRARLYENERNDTTCIVQWGKITACYDSPPVEDEDEEGGR